MQIYSSWQKQLLINIENVKKWYRHQIHFSTLQFVTEQIVNGETSINVFPMQTLRQLHVNVKYMPSRTFAKHVLFNTHLS